MSEELASPGTEWTAEQRFELVLKLVRGDLSIADAACHHGLAEAEIAAWQDRFLRGARHALRPHPLESKSSDRPGRLSLGPARELHPLHSGPSHHSQVVVDLQIYHDNVRHLRALVQPPSLVCCVVKGNAYNHGIMRLVPVARAAGADMFAVCSNEDARAIRMLGIGDVRIMRCRMALIDEVSDAIDLGVEEVVGDLAGARALADLARERDVAIPVHVNLDAGMGRMGFYRHQLEDAKAACTLAGLRVVGVMSHFPGADDETLDTTYRQLEYFEQFHADLVASGALAADVPVGVANTAATVRIPRVRKMGMVRCGAATYGNRTGGPPLPPQFKTVMSFKSTIAMLRWAPRGSTVGYGSRHTCPRDTLVASIPVGFAEGYPRSLACKGIVLIRGERCPVIGKVSMNVLTVDVTDLTEVAVGDEVVLFGRQGDDEITFEEMAELIDSVHTEIQVGIGGTNQITYREPEIVDSF